MIYRFLIICTDRTCKKAKETSVIGDDIQIFKSLHRQGFCKKAKEASVIGDDIQIFKSLHRRG